MKKRADAKPINPESKAEAESASQGSKRSVAIYVVALIIVVLACITLSFFISKRNESIDIMAQNMTKAEKNIELLQEKNVELTTENEKLKKQIDDLKKEKAELEEKHSIESEVWATDNKKMVEKYNQEYNDLLTKYDELKKQIQNTSANGGTNNA